VERRGADSLDAIQVFRLSISYRGNRPKEQNSGPPPVVAYLASVDTATGKPCAVRYSLVSFRDKYFLVSIIIHLNPIAGISIDFPDR
jgi:hypothetical protein